MKEKKQDEKQTKKGFIDIVPLKNFHIVQNEHDIHLIEGEPVSIPEFFKQNMITEKVI